MSFLLPNNATSGRRMDAAQLDALKAMLLSKIVVREDGCWEWIGARCTNGYGQLRFNDRLYMAHRASYEVHVGPIPEGMLCCHVCDHKPCINPYHIFLGTNLDNEHDKIAKGRAVYVRGEKHGLAILNEKDAAEIKFLALEGQLSNAEIAETYGVSRDTVSNIKTGKRWAHVKPVKPGPHKLAMLQRRMREQFRSSLGLTGQIERRI